MELGLQGKQALVLGASRGLGAAVAATLADEGVHVLAAARNTENIEARSSNCVGAIEPLELDLYDIGAIRECCESALDKYQIDILVNNIGGPPPGTPLTIERNDWLKHFEGMAANIFYLTGHLVHSMRGRGWGRVVTITSSGIEQPIPNLAISNSIRSAVLGWSKTLATEVAADGVTVNVVMPGRIHTSRVDQLDANTAARLNKSNADVVADSVANIPLGRYGRPKEFADVVAFLVSAKASYVTGEKVRVDGGSIKSV